jgi:hypothetical protein
VRLCGGRRQAGAVPCAVMRRTCRRTTKRPKEPPVPSVSRPPIQVPASWLGSDPGPLRANRTISRAVGAAKGIYPRVSGFVAAKRWLHPRAVHRSESAVVDIGLTVAPIAGLRDRGQPQESDGRRRAPGARSGRGHAPDTRKRPKEPPIPSVSRSPIQVPASWLGLRSRAPSGKTNNSDRGSTRAMGLSTTFAVRRPFLGPPSTSNPQTWSVDAALDPDRTGRVTLTKDPGSNRLAARLA